MRRIVVDSFVLVTGASIYPSDMLESRVGLGYRGEMDGDDAMQMARSAGPRLELILHSYRRLTGEALARDADALWQSASAVLAHDTKATPEFFYANARTLGLFKRSAEEMIGLPSHLSAEADARAERAAMFAQLEADDMVTGYSGIRIAADGTRFRIRNATIWNVRDEAGILHGQAARIDDVAVLD